MTDVKRSRSQIVRINESNIDLFNFYLAIMTLSLQLNLNSDNQVTVTNSITQAQTIVTLAYIKKITRNSMDILVQYKAYEIVINAQSIWNQIKNFDFQSEAAKEFEIENKFQKIMTPGSWIEITDCDRQKHRKALFLTQIYNRHTGIAKTSKVIDRLKEFNWKIIDINSNFITMYGHVQQAYLIIQNSSTMNKKTFVELINEAGLSIAEFFSTV